MPTILLVDEDSWARAALERALMADPRLGQSGLAIEVAEDGATALAMFRLGRPDAAVIDLTLPDGPGEHFATQLRREPGGAQLTLALVTSAAPDPDELARLESSLGARVFTKPHQLGTLARHLARRLLGVEAAAGPTVAAAHELRGSLAERPLPAVLLDLADAEATGRLSLRRGKVAKEVSLIDGTPHGVASNARVETLGHFLIARGVIRDDDHAAAVARAAATGEKLGAALVALGALSPDELLTELAAQSRFKLERSLRWPDGDWHFVPQPAGANRGEPIELGDLILGGLAQGLAFDPLPAHLAAAQDRPLALTPRGIRLLPALAGRCPSFADRFRTGATVEALAVAGVDRAEILIALDALLLTGGIELGDAVAGAAGTGALATIPSVAALTRRPRTSQPPRDAVPREVMRDDSGVVEIPSDARLRLDGAARQARQALIAEYLRVQGLGHYAVLGLSPAADLDTVTRAAGGLLDRFSRAAYAGAELGRDYGKLEEIEARYRRAQAVLSDPASRAAYDAGLEPADRPSGPPAFATELEVRAAEKAATEGRFDEAIARLTQVVAAVPYEPAYHTALAAATLGRAPADPANRAAALAHADAALALDSDHAQAHEIRGVILAAGGDPTASVHLGRALELDPTLPEALAALERILRPSGQFAALERQYRQLLYRLEHREPRFGLELWRRLAALYRDDLGDLDQARVALGAAHELDPHDASLRAALADIDGGATSRLHQRVVELGGHLIGGDQAAGLELLKTCDLAGATDLGFLVAAVMVRGATPAPAAVERHDRLRPRFVRRAFTALEPHQLARLRHPDDLPMISRLFELVAGPIATAWPIELADLGCSGPTDDRALPDAVRKTRDYLAQLLGVAPPPVALLDALGDEVAVAAVTPPLLLIGAGAAVADRLALAFRAGRAMTYLLPGRAVAGAYPARVLKQAVLAAHLAVHGIPPDRSDPTLCELTRAIGALDAPTRTELGTILGQLTRPQRTLNLSQWTRALARTAARVGLVVCGDPAVALAAVAAGGGPGAERDLAEFALSPDHVELRAALGLSVDV